MLGGYQGNHLHFFGPDFTHPLFLLIDDDFLSRFVKSKRSHDGAAPSFHISGMDPPTIHIIQEFDSKALDVIASFLNIALYDF